MPPTVTAVRLSVGNGGRTDSGVQSATPRTAEATLSPTMIQSSASTTVRMYVHAAREAAW